MNQYFFQNVFGILQLLMANAVVKNITVYLLNRTIQFILSLLNQTKL